MKKHYLMGLSKGWIGKMAILALLFTFLQYNQAKAQTTLAVGDIAFTGYTSNPVAPATDQFSFLLFVPITNGTVIVFTDNGWNSAVNQLVTTESTISWTCSGNIPANTEVHINGLTATIGGTPNGTVTNIVNAAAGLSLSNAGDQVMVYQGAAPATNPTLITGIHMNVEPGPPATTASTWDVLNTAPANYPMTSSRSAMPPGLTTYTNAMWFSTESDNAVFNCAAVPQPNLAALKSALYNPANWTQSDAVTPTLPAGCAVWIGSSMTLTMSSTNVSCNGGSNGTATVSVSGGTAPYTYSWSPSGGTAATATGRSAGTYTVTVTDASSITATGTVTITQPSALTTVGAQSNVSCFGGSNGAATVSVSGGTAPYTYSWSPSGGTAATATGRAAGNYTVTVTDANGCITTRSYSITQPASPVSGSTVVTNVACFGGSNGAINLTPSGGTAPYTFNWGGGITTEDRTGLTAGTYTVSITDNNGCPATVTVSVTQPASPVSGTTVVTNVACFGGSNGAINLTPSGGTGPYTYNWLPSGPTTQDRTGLTAGTYSVQITDANGCTGTVTATVTQPASPVSGTTVVTNVACFGGSNGAINLTPSGGTGPYTYNWLPSGPTTEDRTGLVAGTYSVQITDVNGCTGTVTATVTQPASPVSGTTVVTNVACFGGSNGAINYTPSGGTGPYTYNWGGGITTQDRTGLAAGTYTVITTDANGCTGTVTATVTQPASAVSGTTVVTNVACFGGSNGAINLTPSGGTGPYTYNWLPSGPTTEDRTGLVAGTYTVEITDVNGCTGTVTATVTQPASPVSGTTVVTNVACFGGSNGAINLTPSGGTGPYTYNWLPSGPTTEDRTGLVAGTYTVQITDANGCTGTVTATVTQPASAVSGTTVVTNVACFGGSNGAINLTPSGGTGPYTYNWLPSGPTTEDRTGLVAGTYSVQITDVNGCTGTVTATVTQPASPVSGTTVVTNVACFGGSNGAINLTPSGGTPGYTYNWGGGITTQDRTGLAAGTYTVVITDANGCTGTVTATVTQPAAIVATGSQTNVSCNGGSNASASVTATGGTGAYTYLWAPSGGTAATATGLTAGTYTVTVTDANGCTATRTYSITQPTAITLATSSTTSACVGNTGTATVTSTGGTGAYTYSWSTTPVQTSATATNLGAGTYTVTVTDANSCTQTATVSVVNTAGPSASITASSNVSCNGGSNGSATVTATGGTGSYTYSWAPSGGTAAMATGLTAGNYTVTVTDGNSCQATATVTITQPSAIMLATSVTNVSCNGGSNGSATVTATGGTGSYTYSWAPSGGTAATAIGLTAGSYTVTVTDINSCQATAVITITQPSAIILVTTASNVSCNGGSNGTAAVSATGGTGAYTYSWSPSGGTAATATGLSAGTYTVTVTDANSCQATATVTITQPAAITASTMTTNVSCNGGNNGDAMVMASGGTGTLTYSWNTVPVQTGATATGLTAGSYTVTVTDANGCEITASVTITEPSAVTVVTTVSDVTCNGGSNGSAAASATGGTGILTYSWNTVPAQTGATATGLAAGSYIVTVTDGNSCQVTSTVTITEPSAIALTTASVNVSCNAGSDGAASVAATGGTGTFAYSWNTVPSQLNDTATGLAAGNYEVTVTDANLCIATATVTITEPAALTASVMMTNVSCNGGNNGDAMVMVSGGTGSYTYLWDDAMAQTTATAMGLTAGNYSVIVTDQNLCTITASVTITEPAAVIATVSSTNETCSPANDGTATVAVTGGSGSYTFLWDDAMAQTTATATGLIAGTYSVIVDDGVCPAITATVTVSGSAAPVVTISNDTTVCEGSPVTLIASGGISYAWDNGAGSNDTVVVTPNDTTIYTVTVTDINGCVASASVTVTVNPLAVAGFTYVNTGSDVNFTNTSSNAVSYSWDFGDGSPVDNTASPFHTYVLDGTYVVTMIASNGCGADTITDTIVIFTTGVVEQASMSISVAPNPSEGMFTISVSNAGVEMIYATVVDMQGRVVYTGSMSSSEAASTQIDLTSLAKGVYYIRLNAGADAATKRIVIQ